MASMEEREKEEKEACARAERRARTNRREQLARELFVALVNARAIGAGQKTHTPHGIAAVAFECADAFITEADKQRAT